MRTMQEMQLCAMLCWMTRVRHGHRHVDLRQGKKDMHRPRARRLKMRYATLCSCCVPVTGIVLQPWPAGQQSEACSTSATCWGQRVCGWLVRTRCTVTAALPNNVSDTSMSKLAWLAQPSAEPQWACGTTAAIISAVLVSAAVATSTMMWTDAALYCCTVHKQTCTALVGQVAVGTSRRRVLHTIQKLMSACAPILMLACCVCGICLACMPLRSVHAHCSSQCST